MSDKVFCLMMGVYGLSGFSSPAFVVFIKGKIEIWGVAHYEKKQIVLDVLKQPIESSSSTMQLCICGDMTKISQLCHRFGSCPMYVCPTLNLSLISCQQNKMILDCYKRNLIEKRFLSIFADDKLEGDNYGILAEALNAPYVLNEIMVCHKDCVSPFYGRVLSATAEPQTNSFIVRQSKMDEYFPIEPLSAKLYASQTVPVEFANTEVFAKASGSNAERVWVTVTSERIPGLTVFMNFYELLIGKSIVNTMPANTMSANWIEGTQNQKLIQCYWNGLRRSV